MQDCGALHWKQETFNMCCGKGKIRIPVLQPPPRELQELLDRQDAHYMANVRAYNTALQMASSTIKVDNTLGSWNQMRVNGQIQHLMGSLTPAANELPQYAQLYVLDPKDAVANRMRIFDKLQKSVLTPLQKMLFRENQYVRVGQLCNSSKDLQTL
jgi:hypothetical protein